MPLAHTDAGRFSKHPDYEAAAIDWKVATDCYDGERVIKTAGSEYLPIPSGLVELGVGSDSAIASIDKRRQGQRLYDAYVRRAKFPDLVRQTTEALVGVMLREPWSVTLPTAMEYLYERATARSEQLEVLIARLLLRVLLYGRAGLLNDVTSGTDEVYIADYDPRLILNWDDTLPGPEQKRMLRLVVLDESRNEIQEGGTYSWELAQRYRVVKLDPTTNQYVVEVHTDAGTPPERLSPELRGQALDYIPFTFVGAIDLTPQPDEIPVLALARIALTIYRTEADYRQALFMSGQDTLVLTGVSGGQPLQSVVDASGEQHIPQNQPKTLVGAGAIIYLENPEQDAKYIGVSASGLSELRQAIDNDEKRAEQFGLALLTSGSQAEAAETLKTRVGGRTATLTTIVKTVAAGLLQQLQWIAAWHGADPEEVEIEPNLEFGPSFLGATDLNGYIAAKMAGLPLSWKAIHLLAEQGGLTPFTLEQELEELDNEPELPISPRGEDDPEEVDDE